MEKFKPYLLWIAKIIISMLFLLASIGKLSKNELVIKMFHDWGYFDGFYFMIGLLEFILAILLLIPKTSLYAAVLLFILMIGALITHLNNDPFVEIIRPIIFMSFLSLIIYLQWDKKLLYFKRN